MPGSNLDFFPLEKVSESQLKTLCQVLWGWEYCTQCSNAGTCLTAQCPWQRYKTLKSFFQFYRDITSHVVPENPVDPALRSHEDLFAIIRLLKENIDVPRTVLAEKHFSGYEKDRKPNVADQHQAFNLAVRVMTTVNCSIEHQYSDLCELGLESAIWHGDMSLQEFITSIFPIRYHPSLNSRDVYSDIKNELAAKQLIRTAGLEFEGTNDLRNHLRLDNKTGVVQIYYHTSFLKEHLMATRGSDRVPPMSDPVLCGIIPRGLALETLDSLQNIIFPLDNDSRATFRSLCSKKDFDPDCQQFGYMSYRRENEIKVGYQYWGSRLMDIYHELKDPKPRGILAEWLEMKSKARHVMMATIIGVIVAVVLGILTLAVAIFQTWVSYQQWKYPASSTGSSSQD